MNYLKNTWGERCSDKFPDYLRDCFKRENTLAANRIEEYLRNSENMPIQFKDCIISICCNWVEDYDYDRGDCTWNFFINEQFDIDSYYRDIYNYIHKNHATTKYLASLLTKEDLEDVKEKFGVVNKESKVEHGMYLILCDVFDVLYPEKK